MVFWCSYSRCFTFCLCTLISTWCFSSSSSRRGRGCAAAFLSSSSAGDLPKLVDLVALELHVVAVLRLLRELLLQRRDLRGELSAFAASAFASPPASCGVGKSIGVGRTEAVSPPSARATRGSGFESGARDTNAARRPRTSLRAAPRESAIDAVEPPALAGNRASSRRAGCRFGFSWKGPRDDERKARIARDASRRDALPRLRHRAPRSGLSGGFADDDGASAGGCAGTRRGLF